MAGFFDGEGCIGISKRQRTENYIEYAVRISIGQNDGAIMDWIQENYGGNVYLVKRDNSFMWVATNLVAHKVLERMLPYLKYKKPQALLAISFRDIPKSAREERYQELKKQKSVFAKSRVVRAGSTTKRVKS